MGAAVGGREYMAIWGETKGWNSTFYDTGKYAGRTQLFLTPGLGFGRTHLSGRFRFFIGGGDADGRDAVPHLQPSIDDFDALLILKNRLSGRPRLKASIS